MVKLLLSFIALTVAAFAQPTTTPVSLKNGLGEHLKLSQDFEIVADARRCQCAQGIDEAMVQTLKVEADQRRFSATVNCGNDESSSSCTIRGHIQLLVEIPVLTRTINPGEIINEADLTWLKLPINRVNPATLTSIADLVGKTPAFRMLQPGQALQRNELKAPKVVKRGDLVTVIYRTDGMLLTVQATAKGDAAKGETLILTSPLSKREIRAVATAPNQAEITPVSF